MSVAWRDGPAVVHVGHVLECLRSLDSASVQCVVTSPPYWGLRDYRTAPVEWGDGWVGSLGMEPTPALYVAHLVEVFREVWRVLRPDGTLWLNLGDSYASDVKGSGGSGRSRLGPNGDLQNIAFQKMEPRRFAHGLKPKDLVMVPARVALALQADGWWLRSDVIWSKPNPMPESVTDRPTTAHEHVFLLAKSERYFYDAEAVREPAQDWGMRDRSQAKHNGEAMRIAGQMPHGGFANGNQAATGRNLRNVWAIPTQPFPDAHFATFPEELARRCIAAGTSERGCCPECGTPWCRLVERTGGAPSTITDRRLREMPQKPRHDGGKWESNGSIALNGASYATTGWEPGCVHAHAPVPCTVLDPFAGSGTTLTVARRMGRRAVGIELQPDYLPLIQRRVTAARSLFEEPTRNAPVQVAEQTVLLWPQVLVESPNEEEEAVVSL